MTLLKELRERRIEVGFLRMGASTSEQDVDQEALFEEPLIVAASTNHPITRRRKGVTLGDLVEERWTWPPRGTFIDSLVVEAFHTEGIEAPRATVYVEPINMRIQLAATGRFLAVIPAYILKIPSNSALVKAVRVELPTTRRWIGMATLKNRTLSPITRVFLEWVRETTKRQLKKS